MANRTQRLQKPTANITLGFYSNAKDDGLQSRLKLEADLRVAVEKKQFYLVYQPQVDLSADKIIGVEALLRWRHPQGESVPPFRFIPVLEEIGLINELGDWILEEACRQQVQWQAEGFMLRMGVNLSPAQFDQADLITKIEAIIQKTGIHAQSLELEITESLAMHNPEATIETLQKLRQMGCKIAIDDFGIGFSSLEYLLRFPLTTLKIDRAFVKDITRWTK
ncbi:MAG: EAL domain-containing protein [Nitrincola sp.]|nr:EAL domain-containing protein [Nitrincola sp.]